MSELIKRAGRPGRSAALGADADWDSCGDEESSSVSESLEPEPGPNRKFRLLVVGEDAPDCSEALEDTRDQRGNTNSTVLKRESPRLVLIEHLPKCKITNSHIAVILGLGRQSVANQGGHLFNELAGASYLVGNVTSN